MRVIGSYTTGVGCYGLASILLARHAPSRSFVVVRQVDLDPLTGEQLAEVQHEMKLSQLVSHPNIIGYHCSFVTGCKLWAIQSLTHYGECIGDPAAGIKFLSY